MWTLDDLKRAAEARDEHTRLGGDVEKVILAAERAMGRTEEVLRRDLAKDRLKALLAVLDMHSVPDHIRKAHPLLSAQKGLVPIAPPAPPPLPLPTIDKAALAAELKTAEAGLKVGESGKAQKTISMEPQAVKDRSRGGPSR